MINIEDIAKAFNKHKEILTISEVDLCCNRGKITIIANQGVMLRRILEELGYKDEAITKVLHKV